MICSIAHVTPLLQKIASESEAVVKFGESWERPILPSFERTSSLFWCGNNIMAFFCLFVWNVYPPKVLIFID